jgi:hypothetical protein
MIANDFHLTKDYRQIRGKSFVIMGGTVAPTGLPGHTGQAIARRRARNA